MSCKDGRPTGSNSQTRGWRWLRSGPPRSFYLGRRFLLALMTLRGRAWTPTLSRILSRMVRSNDYSEEAFFRADGADENWVTRRRRGLDRLAAHFQSEYPRSISWGDAIREDSPIFASQTLGECRSRSPE